jgi:cytochrome c peroxidase
LGAEGQQGKRNAMPLFNLAWRTEMFWDGRSPSLRHQVLRPIEDPLEMHETLPQVAQKLQETEVYPPLFQKAFGSTEVTAERLAKALEQYLLTLISAGSKLDQWREAKAQLTTEEQQGFELFFTESDPGRGIRGADCFHCHGGAHFTNNSYSNNGLDLDPQDLGRATATHEDRDKGKFLVPSLRNVALTAPYMHDGRFATLEEVIEHYDHGIQRSTTLDPNLAKHLKNQGLGLTQQEKQALLAFLHTLTDLEIVR